MRLFWCINPSIFWVRWWLIYWMIRWSLWSVWSGAFRLAKTARIHGCYVRLVASCHMALLHSWYIFSDQRDPTQARTPRSELPAENLIRWVLLETIVGVVLGVENYVAKGCKRVKPCGNLVFPNTSVKDVWLIYDTFSVLAFGFSWSICRCYKFTEAVPSPPVKSSSLAFVEAAFFAAFSSTESWQIVLSNRSKDSQDTLK